MIKLIKISLVFFIFIALLSYCYAGYEDDLATEANETHDDISELNEDIIEVYENKEIIEVDNDYNENMYEPNEPDLVEQIKNIDLSSVKVSMHSNMSLIEFREFIEHVIKVTLSWEEYEWVETYVNGQPALILQVDAYFPRELKSRIVMIFVFDIENQETKVVYEHTSELPRFLFLTKSGDFIWYHFSYGFYCWNSYTLNTFDEEWKRVRRYGLTTTLIYSMDEMPETWAENNPEMAGVGVYFEKTFANYDGSFIREMISEETFMQLFEEMTGFSFSYVLPEWWKSGE